MIDTDVNHTSLYEEKALTISKLDLSDVDGSSFDSLLKISHSSVIIGTELVIPQGHENAVDIDVCQDINLSGRFGGGAVTGDQVVTVKGGTKNFTLKGIIIGRGLRGYEVGIGNWMDQSYAMSRDGVVNFIHDDGGMVRVAIGWAVPFSIKLGPKCQYMAWASLQLKAYWLLKYIIRLCAGIKKGEKGPGWI